MCLVNLLLQTGELLQYLIVGLAVYAQACEQRVAAGIDGLGSRSGFGLGAGLGLGFGGRLFLRWGLFGLGGGFLYRSFLRCSLGCCFGFGFCHDISPR